MDTSEYPAMSAKDQIKAAAANFEYKKHPGMHDPAVIREASDLLHEMYDMSKRRGIAPAAWSWVTNLPNACLVLTHAKVHPPRRGLTP